MQLILRSLRFHWRTHLGVALGAAVATAVLVGALVVGDSVKGSLKAMAEARLGEVDYAMGGGDRFFTEGLGKRIAEEAGVKTAGVIDLIGVIKVEGEGGKGVQVPGVHLLGVDEGFWEMGGVTSPFVEEGDSDGVVLNSHLARKLGIDAERVNGGEVVEVSVWASRPSALSADLALESDTRESSMVRVMRKRVVKVVDDEGFGRFSLLADQLPAMNVFVDKEMLAKEAEVEGKVNLMLARKGKGERHVDKLNEVVGREWELEDGDLSLKHYEKLGVMELRTSRIFLDSPVVEHVREAVKGSDRVLTYFVNSLERMEKLDGKDMARPYSMVSAFDVGGRVAGKSGSVVVPPNMEKDGMVVNAWLAKAMQLNVGDGVRLKYFVMGDNRELVEKSAEFKVAGIVETERKVEGEADGMAVGGDRHLMPDFPGMAKAIKTDDWELEHLKVDTGRIKPVDEKYWKDHRGTPKAYVSMEWAHGEGGWKNRFGDVTALRWSAKAQDLEGLAKEIRGAVGARDVGLVFKDVRGAAMDASVSGTDFGGLFVGMSFFLMVAALLLTALLFAFGVEQRASEIGVLRAMGFTVGGVRRLFLAEGLVLAVVGGAVGVFGGVEYTKLVLWALSNVWSEAVVKTELGFYMEGQTVGIGWGAGVLVALMSMWWAMRQVSERSVRVLMASWFGVDEDGGEEAVGKKVKVSLWVGVTSLLGAAGLAVVGGGGEGRGVAGAFFGAGALLLIGGIYLSRMLFLKGLGGSGEAMSGAGLAWRNATRRRGRSLATVSMLACGVFLIVAINAFRHDPGEGAEKVESGTGGYAFFGTTVLPVVHDLNDDDFDLRDKYGLADADLSEVEFVQMRMRGGDEASCLNLNKPQAPPLLGVKSEVFAKRGAFTFKREKEKDRGWAALDEETKKGDVPVVIDDAVAMWVLKVGIGDYIDYVDERGEEFRLVVVGTLDSSVLQGFVVMSEKNMLERFPSISGYRAFLIDVGSGADRAAAVKKVLLEESDLPRDFGIDLTGTTKRLAMFGAVEATYMTIFGVLGGLGLVLGCVGLGLVVLRNVLERRGELALMRSLGYTKGRLRRLILGEHVLLLLLGMGCGVVAAVLAVGPVLNGGGKGVPVGTIGWLLVGILVSGLFWTVGATVGAVRGKLIRALRHE